MSELIPRSGLDASKVVDFPLAPSGYAARASAEPVGEVIERLEDLLDRAKRGDLRSFAMTTVTTSGVTASVWAATDGWFHEITSGLAVLQFRWMCDNSGYHPNGEHPAS